MEKVINFCYNYMKTHTMPLPRLRRLLSGENRNILRHFPPQRTSIRRRILRQSLLLTGFTVAVLSLLSCIVAHSLVSNRVLGQLSSTVASRENLLSRSLQYDRERTALLTTGQELRVRILTSGPRVLPDLWSKLLQEDVPARGMTLFDMRGAIRDAVGMAIPAPAAPVPSTRLQPVMNKLGRWDATVVYAPVRDKQNRNIGTLAIRYDPSSLLAQLGANPSLGSSSETLLLRPEEGGAALVFSLSEQRVRSEGNVVIDHPLFWKAATDDGEVYTGPDEHGITILAAYRNVPATGWGLLLKVDSADAFFGWGRFAVAILVIDVFLLLLSGVFGLMLAHELSFPLLHLAEKMRRLKPGKWQFHRSIKTGDEVETVDYAASELSNKLRESLRRIEGMKSEFIRIASDRLRTPLSTIRWYLELIHGEGFSKLSGAQKEQIKEMDDAGKRLDSLLNDLLDLGSFEKLGERNATKKSKKD
jgi:hypothetical protein